MISKKSLKSIIEEELNLLSGLNEQTLGNVVTRDAPFGPEGFPEDALGRPDLGGSRGRGPVHGRYDDSYSEKDIGMGSALLFGEIAAGFTPAGVAIDMRDTAQAIRDRDKVGFGLAMLGFIPGLGDAGKKILSKLRGKGGRKISAADDLTVDDIGWHVDEVADSVDTDVIFRRADMLESPRLDISSAARKGFPNIKGGKLRRFNAGLDSLDNVNLKIAKAENLLNSMEDTVASGGRLTRTQSSKIAESVADLTGELEILENAKKAVSKDAVNGAEWVSVFNNSLDEIDDTLADIRETAAKAAQRNGAESVKDLSNALKKAADEGRYSGVSKRKMFGIVAGAVGLKKAYGWWGGPSPAESDPGLQSIVYGDEEIDDQEDTGLQRENNMKIKRNILEKIIKEEIRNHYLLEQIDLVRGEPEVVVAQGVASGEIEGVEPPGAVEGVDPYNATQWGLAIASFFPIAGEAADTASVGLFLAEAADLKGQGDIPGYEAAMGNAVFTAALIPVPILGTWLNKLIPNKLTGWIFRKFGGGRAPDIDLSNVPTQSDEITEVMADFERRVDDIGGTQGWDEMPIPDRRAAAREAMEEGGLPVTTGPHSQASSIADQIDDGRALATEVTQQSDAGIKFADEITDITVGTGTPPPPRAPRAGGAAVSAVADVGSRSGENIIRRALDAGPMPHIPRSPLMNGRLARGLAALQRLDAIKAAGKAFLDIVRTGKAATDDVVNAIRPIGEELATLSKARETAAKQAGRRAGQRTSLEAWDTAYKEGHEELFELAKNINREALAVGGAKVANIATLKAISKAFNGSRGPIRDFYSYVGGGRTLMAVLATGTVGAIVVIGSSYEAPASAGGGESDFEPEDDFETSDVDTIDEPDQEAAVGSSGRIINTEDEITRTDQAAIIAAEPEDLVLVDNSGTQIDVAPLVKDAQEAAGGPLPDALKLFDF
tara:strand:+ start:1884 stop:4721 length:2838 start_codon:yes stop_codon:yes gene_type:complete